MPAALGGRTGNAWTEIGDPLRAQWAERAKFWQGTFEDQISRSLRLFEYAHPDQLDMRTMYTRVRLVEGQRWVS